ncbi:hypothetical protein AWB75_04280 [Caballeronia catudaia]|uniref:Uncharacterized protein n=1 Tax=Caballeronia catudaia TaxID=1777136 RepID=A0A158C013_9BURK|nr:hypothetical protein AWB75_04280 [Caballeronia catudaia]
MRPGVSLFASTRRKKDVRTISLSTFPCGDGKTSVSCSVCSFSRLTSARAGAGSATRCGSFALILCGGTVQIPVFRSNSSQIAPRTSPLRAAVRIEKSKAARVASPFEFHDVRFDERGKVARRRRRLVLFPARLFRQDMIDHANRVRRDMAMRPRPLHDGVHPLTDAAGGFPLFKPDRLQHVNTSLPTREAFFHSATDRAH